MTTIKTIFGPKASSTLRRINLKTVFSLGKRSKCFPRYLAGEINGYFGFVFHGKLGQKITYLL